jgi:hypothetical protein
LIEILMQDHPKKKEQNEIRRTVPCAPETHGALAMLGFAKRFRPVRRTEEWMAELREGEI